MGGRWEWRRSVGWGGAAGRGLQSLGEPPTAGTVCSPRGRGRSAAHSGNGVTGATGQPACPQRRGPAESQGSAGPGHPRPAFPAALMSELERGSRSSHILKVNFEFLELKGSLTERKSPRGRGRPHSGGRENANRTSRLQSREAPCTGCGAQKWPCGRSGRATGIRGEGPGSGLLLQATETLQSLCGHPWAAARSLRA